MVWGHVRPVRTKVALKADGWIGGVWVAIHVIAARTGIPRIAAAERAAVGAVVRRDVGAIAAVVATHRPSLGGQCGTEDRCGENEFH